MIFNQHPNIEHTNKLLSHLISLPEVICPEDEGVDDAEHRDHVRDVICGLQLVHDDAEAVLLCLHTLREELIVSAKSHLGVTEETLVILEGLEILLAAQHKRVLLGRYSRLKMKNHVTQIQPQINYSRSTKSSSACLVVVQGIQRQPMAIWGEHAEGSEQLKELLLHHGVGSVQGCETS